MDYNLYRALLKQNQHHLDELLAIVQRSGEPLEGNCFYYHNTFETDASFENKQRNIMQLASQSNNILEIGFNAGHSAFLMLVMNPVCRIHAFDICEHSYTKPCLDYLNSVFDNRVTLHEGNSHQTLAEYSQLPDTAGSFDLLHIDGYHEYFHTNLDFFGSRAFAKSGAYCIFDDVDDPGLKSLWDGYVKDGHLTEVQLLDTPTYAHALGKYE
jgi:predicted O-methyltransferase YrrM